MMLLSASSSSARPLRAALGLLGREQGGEQHRLASAADEVDQRRRRKIPEQPRDRRRSMLALCGHHGLPGLRALSTEVFLTRSRLGTEKEEEYDGGGGAKKFLNSVCLALSADPRARYQFLPPLTRQEEAVKFAEKVLMTSPELDNKSEMVELLHSIRRAEEEDEEVAERCLDNFQSWAGKSKLAIGYLLHANRRGLKSEEFITRLVRHLCQRLDDLKTEELVALMLMFYFRKSWDLEEVCEFVSSTELQGRFSRMLSKQSLSYGEICAVCIGLKKISGFSATHADLRYYLYETMYDIGQALSGSGGGGGGSTELEEMAVVQICTLLTRGGQLAKRDDRRVVEQTMGAFIGCVELMRTDTAVKMMSFGVTANLNVPELTSATCRHHIRRSTPSAPSSLLGLRDLCGALNFLSRVEEDWEEGAEPTAGTLNALQSALAVRLEEAAASRQPLRLADLSDVLKCAVLLSHLDRYDEDFCSAVFAALNSLPDELFDDGGGGSITEDAKFASARCLLGSLSTLTLQDTPEPELRRYFGRDFSASEDCFCRPVAALAASLSVDRPDFPAGALLRSSLAEKFLLPRGEETWWLEGGGGGGGVRWEELGRQERKLLALKKSMDVLFEGEGYCALVPILPHLGGPPELVFGNVAGIKVRVSDKLMLPPGCSSSGLTPRPAPQTGNWFVLVTEPGGKSRKHKVQGMGRVNDRARRRQLRSLGYRLVRVRQAELEMGGGGAYRRRKEEDEERALRFVPGTLLESPLTPASSPFEPSPALVDLVHRVNAGMVEVEEELQT